MRRSNYLAYKLIYGASLLVLTCCHTSTEEPREAASPLVETVPVVRGTAIERLEIAGTLQPLPGQDVKLAPLSAGRLFELLKGEGDAVRAGELLGRIDPAPLRASVDQAKAQLEQAKANEENTRLHQARSERAVDAGVAARQELEDAQLAARSALAQLGAAQSTLAAATNQLERSELRAPFDGLVAHVFAAQGESIDAGRAVLEIARTRELELRAAVPAESASRLAPGQAAELLSAGAHAQAKVLAVAPVIDASTGTATVRLKAQNPDGALKAGAFAHAWVAIAQHEGALLVPRAALVPGEENVGQLCVVDGDSIAHCKAVQTRPAQDGMVELLAESAKQAGIDAGARAIVQGAYALPDGTRVRTGPAREEIIGTPTKTDGAPTKPPDAPER